MRIMYLRCISAKRQHFYTSLSDSGVVGCHLIFQLAGCVFAPRRMVTKPHQHFSSFRTFWKLELQRHNRSNDCSRVCWGNSELKVLVFTHEKEMYLVGTAIALKLLLRKNRQDQNKIQSKRK